MIDPIVDMDFHRIESSSSSPITMVKLIVFVIANLLLYVVFRFGRIDIFLFYAGVIPFVSYYFLCSRSAGLSRFRMIVTGFVAFTPSLIGMTVELYISNDGLSGSSLKNFFLGISGTILIGLIAGWLLFFAIRNKGIRDSLFAGITLLFVTSSVGAIGWSVRLPVTGVLYLLVTFYLIHKYKYKAWMTGAIVYLPFFVLGTLISNLFLEAHFLTAYIDLVVPISIFLGMILARLAMLPNRAYVISYSVFLLSFYLFSHFGMKALISNRYNESLNKFWIYDENAFRNIDMEEIFADVPKLNTDYEIFFFYLKDSVTHYPALRFIDSIRNSIEESTSLILVRISESEDRSFLNTNKDFLPQEKGVYQIEVESDKTEIIERLLNIQSYPHISVLNDSLRILYNDQLLNKRQKDLLVSKICRQSDH